MSWQKEKRWRRFCGNESFLCESGAARRLRTHYEFEISDYARGWLPAAVTEPGCWTHSHVNPIWIDFMAKRQGGVK